MGEEHGEDFSKHNKFRTLFSTSKQKSSPNARSRVSVSPFKSDGTNQPGRITMASRPRGAPSTKPPPTPDSKCAISARSAKSAKSAKSKRPGSVKRSRPPKKEESDSSSNSTSTNKRESKKSENTRKKSAPIVEKKTEKPVPATSPRPARSPHEKTINQRTIFENDLGKEGGEGHLAAAKMHEHKLKWVSEGAAQSPVAKTPPPQHESSGIPSIEDTDAWKPISKQKIASAKDKTSRTEYENDAHTPAKVKEKARELQWMPNPEESPSKESIGSREKLSTTPEPRKKSTAVSETSRTSSKNAQQEPSDKTEISRYVMSSINDCEYVCDKEKKEQDNHPS